jgi:integrase
LPSAHTHLPAQRDALEIWGDIYSLTELAALFNAASEQTEDARYTREHWWRFLMLAVGTASRETALRELTWQQVNLRLGRVRLNPEGRRQTKKRRAAVPIAPTLGAELASLQRHGKALHPPPT